MKNPSKKISLILIVSLMVVFLAPVASVANETMVNLGIADSFAILAGSEITNTGSTVINGDVGLHPGTSFTGQAAATINGEIHITDAVALSAKTDLLAAYNDAAGRIGSTIGSELGGSTLTPGVYSSASSLELTGTLILDGQNDPNAVFIFQAGSTLTTESGSNVELINGAKSSNIYWQVGTSATLGINSNFKGNILASESITATTGADTEGRLLALNGAVTLDTNTVSIEESGALTVTKTLAGDIGSMTLPIFEITVTGPEGFSETRVFVDGETFTWDNLTPGTYNVTESRIGLSDEWVVSGEGSIEVIADDISMSTIVNTYTTTDTPLVGSLTVGKTVAGDIGNMTLPIFEITVTGPENFSATRSFVHGETYTWVNLVPGVYNVTENHTGLSNEWVVSGEGTIDVVSDETSLATVTNTYTATLEPLVGSITVGKSVDGDISNMTLPLFEITLTGPEDFSATRTFIHGETYTWINLTPGIYSLTESRVGLSSEWEVSGERLIDVVADETSLAIITNTYTMAEESLVGTLIVGKAVAGDTNNMELPTFEITVTGPNNFSITRAFADGETYTWDNLLPGTYSVTEVRTGMSSEWTVTGERTVDVIADQTEMVVITNTYEKIEVIPQTGQNTNYNSAIILGSIVAIMGVLSIMIGYKKKKISE